MSDSSHHKPPHKGGLRIDPQDRILLANGESPKREGGEAPPHRSFALRPAKPRREKKPKPPREPGRRRRSLARTLLLGAMTAAIWGVVAIAAMMIYYAHDLPDIDKMTETSRRPAVSFMSSDGENFASYGDLYGDPISLDKVPAWLPEAVIATEDRRFYHHFGIDPIGVARATWVNYRAGKMVQGGSSLTQQLAKNLFLSPDKTAKRKVQELIMALWLERRFTKDQILTLYLNRVYLGSGTHGVDAAAKQYFGIPAQSLTLYQSALLAGLLKAPSHYSPRGNPDGSFKRTVQVLANMVAVGYITEDQAQAAAAIGPGTLRHYVPGGRYFADWLYEQVQQYAGEEARDLVIYTTLDMKLQRRAEAALQDAINGQGAKLNVTQGSIIVMGHDGSVRALVGGKDYDDSQFNRATQGLRQPGSSFKPFVYLTAIEHGHTPDEVIEDGPVHFGDWSPTNYGGKYEGSVTLRHALAKSINTVAIKLAADVGPKNVVATARRLGITSNLRPDLSIALGTSEVSPMELTGAYAAFANGGYGVWPYGIREIRDGKGNVIYHREGGGPGRLIDQSHLAPLVDMMSAVMTEGTGKGANIGRPAAGKSGTTQEYKDAWFVGFTADYVASVWLGNDDNSEMKKVSGATLPAQLWKQVMLAAHEGLPVRDLPGLQKGYDAPQDGAAVEDGPGETPDTTAFGRLLNSLFGR